MLAILGALFVLGGCERQGAAATSGPFDGDKALSYARAFLEFGARVPNSDAASKAGDWIVAQMRQRADTVIEQRFDYTTATKETLHLRNIIARFRPTATERVLYLTHWDSRPISDEDLDPAKRKLPVLGANDGASGVALFIALGDVFKKTAPSVGVDLLFTDGEDYGDFGPPEVDVLIGSKYFAEHLPSPDYQPLYGVLWDMIGDADLGIFQEEYSLQRAPEVVSRVWQTAEEAGYSQYFRPQPKYPVTDDHIPLLDKGLRVIDVIDLDYLGEGRANYHHTQQDTIDKISAHSLKVVGDVAWKLVQ
jgi:Zn-dependent M28 family amino/carboxypeptidase